MNVYFAGPLFTQAETIWNRGVVAGLRARGLTVFCPQEEAIPFVDISVTPPDVNGQGIFNINVRGLREADVIVAILDGTQADDGTSWECGAGYILETPIIGVRSDFRKAGDVDRWPVNLQIAGGISKWVFVDHETEIDEVAAQIYWAILEVM